MARHPDVHVHIGGASIMHGDAGHAYFPVV